MSDSNDFNINLLVLDSDRHGFPEPTLLPHLSNSISVGMLPMLMDSASEAAAGSGAFPPWPLLISAVGDRVASRVEGLSDDAVISLLLKNHTALYSHIGASLIDKAIATTAELGSQWQSAERAERLCRLAARHPEHDDGVLVDLAVAALLDLETAQRTRSHAWFFKIASTTERRNIIDSWTQLEVFDVDALIALFSEADHAEREQLASWLLDQGDHGMPEYLRIISTASVLHFLPNPARVTAVGMLGKTLGGLMQSLPPWWVALACSQVYAVAPETVIALPDIDPLWQSWIATFSADLAETRDAVVMRAHPGSTEWAGLPDYPGLSEKQSDDLLDAISARWGGAEMAASSAAEPAAPSVSQPLDATERPAAQPATEQTQSMPTTAAPNPPPQPETRASKPRTAGILERLGDALGGLLGGRRADTGEEELVMRGPASSPRPSLSPRRLQADVSLADQQVTDSEAATSLLTRGFISGATHNIGISVGRGGSIQVSDDFAEPIFGDGRDSETLAVRVVYNNRVSVGEITLPKDASVNSSVWQAPLNVQDGEPRVEATIVILHKDRVLQVATLSGQVFASLTEEMQADSNIAFEVTADVHDFSGLAVRASFDAAVVTDGKSGAAFAGTGIGVRDLKGVDATIERMTDRLFKTSEAAAITDGGGTPEAFEKLLVFLAAHGKVLHSTLIRQLMPALDQANRIQIVTTNPSAILPLEFVYAGPSPMSNATLCAHWQQSVEKGVCNDCATLPADQRSATVCPLHFWALSKVVERHAPGKPGLDAHDFRVSTQPSSERKQLAPLKSAVFAASDNVPEGLVESTLALLTESVAHCEEARTWSDWMQSVETHSPSLLVSMPHNALDPLLEISTLEIGGGDSLRAGEVTRKLVRRESSEVGPIVLLLGCQTAVGQRQPFHTFVGEFRHNGAAIVIGTFSTVLAEHAAPVVQAIISELSQPSQSTGAETMGDVLLRIRRRMFARGILIALAVAAFGDADWTLANPRTGGP